MSHKRLQHDGIEQCLEEDISSCSEDEDFEEFSDHNTDSEQEDELLDFFEPIIDRNENLDQIPSARNLESTLPDYLESVPLFDLRRGYFLGKDGATKWYVREPVQNIRTRAHNIIYETPGPKNEAINCIQIIDAWSLIFTNDNIQSIVNYTNIYIENNFRQKYSRLRDCRDTDIIEVKALFGLLYYIGRLRGAHLNTMDLWAKDGSGSDICIATMSRRRFHLLLASLRFDDIRTRQERREQDKLAAIREVFDNFNNNIKLYYSLNEHVTIDEKLEKFRGRCPFRQYIPSKPGKYGVKVQVMADAVTYYTHNLEIYVGRNEGPYDVSNSAIDLVKRLVEPIKNTHRNIVMDNWFTSFQLLEDLFTDNGLTGLGTVRKNKRELPPCFVTSAGREVNSSLFGFQKNCTLVSYVPRRGKVVLLASTMHHDAKIDDDEKKKPEMIIDYNRNKCGVDVVDEMCATYSVSRITKRWPLVTFYGLLNIGAINAYVIVKSNDNSTRDKKPRRDYIKDLALQLTMPQIRKRANLPSIPRYIKEKINFILSGHDNGNSQQPSNGAGPSSSTSRKRCATSRCQECPAKKDRKTNSCCQICDKMLCREHSIPVCGSCVIKINNI